MSATRRIPSHAEIEHLAYEIWQQKGRPDGRSLECWLEAERKLLQKARPPQRAAAAGGKRTGRFDNDLDTQLAELLSRTPNSGRQRSPTAL